jgi:tetratricopeptide (TPR) repeat protein
MAADAGIFQQYLNPVRSVMDYRADMDKQEQNALTLASSRLTNQQAQQAMADDQAARQASIQSGGDTNKMIQLLQQSGNYKAAQAYQKQLLDSQKVQADTGLANAHAKNFTAQTDAGNYDLQLKKHDQAIKEIAGFSSPQDAVKSLEYHVKQGSITPEQGQAMLQGIPQDPAQFPAWQMGKLKGLMTAKEQMALAVPDANTVATNQTSRANNAATNAMSRANNASTQAAENLRAGVMPGGGLDDNAERTAQAIASGQLPAPTGMALLNPKNQRILGRVMEINPSYDASTVSAKKAAATAFTSGQQGNSMRSFAVAGQHLDQLGQLADALNNGNSQLVNKIANAYSQQTGSPAVTNFDAAKDVVSKEVVKAIVAGGGGVAEREELSKLMANAKSPAQLKGVITQYRNLMAAQHDALLQQRRAAGLPDSTMPNYVQPEAAATGGLPDDIAALVKKHGGK